MESTRQAKISRLIQKELSEIFRRQTSKLRGVLVSVSAVRVSPDLSIARAYLSVFPSDKAAEVVQSIKTPELAFYLDDSLDYIENIDNLLEADARKHPAHPEKELPEAPAEEELPPHIPEKELPEAPVEKELPEA